MMKVKKLKIFSILFSVLFIFSFLPMSSANAKTLTVTAAHCLYSEEDGGWATSVIVVPGMNGNNMPFAYAYATSISAPQGWTKSGSSDYDWGLIKLNTNMGEKPGYFGVYWGLTSLNGSNVDITGYPGEKSRTLWKMNGNLTDSSTYRLSYTIDTTGGQSGCPVYWKDSSGHRIVGIHTLGSSSVNSATRVTKSVFDAMMNFI